jgi:hypothetical protein
MSGRKHFDESRKKISDSKIGSKHYDESRKKMVDAHKEIENSGRFKTGENNPMFEKSTLMKLVKKYLGGATCSEENR